jgi:hypothetical protein
MKSFWGRSGAFELLFLMKQKNMEKKLSSCSGIVQPSLVTALQP